MKRTARRSVPRHPERMAAPRPTSIFSPYSALLFCLVVTMLVAVGWWSTVNHDDASPTSNSTTPNGRNTPLPPKQIGIIAGHNRVKTLPNGETLRDPDGPFDMGAVCEDHSAIEADITLDVAQRVVNELRQKDKLNAVLLGEFDPRLRGYFGSALISIHADACIRNFSGYKVARLITSAVPDSEDQLVNCLREQYQAITGLAEHRNTITPDMQEYHAFREIALTTPGAIIELGFLRDDQALLKQGDLPVQGVVEGIRCFLKK